MKLNIKKLALNAFFCFGVSASYAADTKNNVCVPNLHQMPRYKVTFKLINQPGIKSPENRNFTQGLGFRFYQPWGDGSLTGWQRPVTLPTVMLGKKQIPIQTEFAYWLTPEDDGYYPAGQFGFGFDQYAQYYQLYVTAEDLKEAKTNKITVIGTFPQLAYLSMTRYTFYFRNQFFIDKQERMMDKDMEILDDGCNPYIQHNPSVFAYPTTAAKQASKPKKSLKEILQAGKQNPVNQIHKLSINEETGQVDVYRVPKDTSSYLDGLAKDGCSNNYLFAQPGQEVSILRIKVPSMFVTSANPDKTFGQYQIRYLSVGAHRAYPIDDLLPADLLNYWTVNPRMLNDYKDEQGYAYVFFAPANYVNKLAQEQNTPETQPPVMTWGHYKGYVLSQADFAIIVRYRDPDANWKGNPLNAQCYKNMNEAKPVTAKELGEYLPEVYGDTFANFESGKIGVINKDAEWPKS